MTRAPEWKGFLSHSPCGEVGGGLQWGLEVILNKAAFSLLASDTKRSVASVFRAESRFRLFHPRTR